MPNPVGLFCKSFRDDFAHLAVMLASFGVHNPDGLPLTLSLPQADISSFADRFGRQPGNVRIVPDESYCGHDPALYQGWHWQQVCKLMSWRIVDERYYAVVDSDCYFIRDVGADDFRPRERGYIAYGSLLRTVFPADNDDLVSYIRGASADIFAYRPPTPASNRCDLARFIHYRDLDPGNPGPIERGGIPMKIFGEPRYIFYQPGQVFSRDLLVAFNYLLRQYGLTAGDAIRISPWEYCWYGSFASHSFHDETEFRASAVLHFRSDAGIAQARNAGVTEAQLASRFCIIQMAARHLAALKFEGEGLPSSMLSGASI